MQSARCTVMFWVALCAAGSHGWQQRAHHLHCASSRLGPQLWCEGVQDRRACRQRCSGNHQGVRAACVADLMTCTMAEWCSTCTALATVLLCNSTVALHKNGFVCFGVNGEAPLLFRRTCCCSAQVFDQVDLDSHYALWPADKLDYSAVGLDVG